MGDPPGFFKLRIPWSLVGLPISSLIVWSSSILRSVRCCSGVCWSAPICCRKRSTRLRPRTRLLVQNSNFPIGFGFLFLPLLLKLGQAHSNTIHLGTVCRRPRLFNHACRKIAFLLQQQSLCFAYFQSCSNAVCAVW